MSKLKVLLGKRSVKLTNSFSMEAISFFPEEVGKNKTYMESIIEKGLEEPSNLLLNSALK